MTMRLYYVYCSGPFDAFVVAENPTEALRTWEAWDFVAADVADGLEPEKIFEIAPDFINLGRPARVLPWHSKDGLLEVHP